MSTTYKIGIDVGGTFTDFFVWSGDGRVSTFKVLSTPRDPSIGVLDGLGAIAEAEGVSLAELVERILTIVHGTTVTTNAVLTRDGAEVALLTTEGVRDALEMRRGIREEQYDNRYLNVTPLVPRRLRRPIRGRLDRDGQELAPLSLQDVRDSIEIAKQAGVTAVAICFMNSFLDPVHERSAAELVRAEMPDAYVSVSSSILPTIRFYNRVSTTVLNAYVGPVLHAYLGSLEARLAEAGFTGVLLIMQSSGGVAAPAVVQACAATTLLSGPAAGPVAGHVYAAHAGHASCLVVDMGGTSFDASLVREGVVALKPQGEIDRLRTALPMLDIVTIGAGGGSVGWIDAGGLLRMGPRSAGADPGPACYGRGGDEPTCTDADLILGYLDPESFAGGQLTLDTARATAVVTEKVAVPLGLTTARAAAGMFRVINANMAHGVREITVKRGLDPREFPLVVAGGACGLHACAIADELGIETVVVSPVASITCAAGMLLTNLQHDLVRSCVMPLSPSGNEKLIETTARLVAEGEAQLAGEGVGPERRRHRVALDLRYAKQYHEVTVPVPREAIEAGDHASIARAFHAEHDRLYGYELEAEGTPIELISVRVSSVGEVDKPELPRMDEGDTDPRPALVGERRAYVPARDAFEEVPVYDGHLLTAGMRIEGPALIERRDTTVFVGAAFVAQIDTLGSAILQRGGAR